MAGTSLLTPDAKRELVAMAESTPKPAVGNWSRAYAAYIYLEPPIQMTKREDITRDRMLLMNERRELIGKPICFEHDENNRPGRIFDSKAAKDGSTVVFFRFDMNQPSAGDYKDMVDNGLLQCVSLSHMPSTKNPVEVSLVRDPGRDARILMHKTGDSKKNNLPNTIVSEEVFNQLYINQLASMTPPVVSTSSSDIASPTIGSGNINLSTPIRCSALETKSGMADQIQSTIAGLANGQLAARGGVASAATAAPAATSAPAPATTTSTSSMMNDGGDSHPGQHQPKAPSPPRGNNNQPKFNNRPQYDQSGGRRGARNSGGRPSSQQYDRPQYNEQRDQYLRNGDHDQDLSDDDGGGQYDDEPQYEAPVPRRQRQQQQRSQRRQTARQSDQPNDNMEEGIVDDRSSKRSKASAAAAGQQPSDPNSVSAGVKKAIEALDQTPSGAQNEVLRALKSLLEEKEAMTKQNKEAELKVKESEGKAQAVQQEMKKSLEKERYEKAVLELRDALTAMKGKQQTPDDVNRAVEEFQNNSKDKPTKEEAAIQMSALMQTLTKTKTIGGPARRDKISEIIGDVSRSSSSSSSSAAAAAAVGAGRSQTDSLQGQWGGLFAPHQRPEKPIQMSALRKPDYSQSKDRHSVDEALLVIEQEMQNFKHLEHVRIYADKPRFSADRVCPLRFENNRSK